MSRTISQSPDGHNDGAKALVVAVLAVALVASCVLAVGTGAAALEIGQVAGTLTARSLGTDLPPGVSLREATIVWELRAPRVVTGAFVGAALSVGGATLQALVRNMLADPYLLGVSSGASLGAATVISLGAGALLGGVTLVGGAFLGACLSVVLLLALTRVGGTLAVHRLVLAGLVVSFFLTALTNLVVSVSGSRDTVRAVMFWTLGSLGQADWSTVPVLVSVVTAVIGVLTLWARRLDAIALGDDVCRSLGTDPARLRARATLVTAVGVSAAVAVSGAVGFVGLVVPHIARRIVGATHRVLLLTSALLGALVLVWGDLLARTLLAPRELPLGVLTALIGTPLLMSLVRRHGSGAHV